MDITPGQDVTFTITKVPTRLAQQKTIQRLMRLQPDVQKGLKDLARRRRQHDNVTYVRAGRPWVNRKRTTKLTRVAEGEQFTLRVQPQIIPDLNSVEKFLEMKAVKAAKTTKTTKTTKTAKSEKSEKPAKSAKAPKAEKAEK